MSGKGAKKDRSHSELSLRSERLSLLSDVASLLLLSDEPRVILDRVFRMLSAHLGLEAYFNYLVTDDGSRMRLYEYGGIAADVAKRIEWLEYGQAVFGCVARDRARIIAEDVQRSSDPRTDLIRSLGITAYCCHPLIAHEKLIGTLSFGTRDRATFRDDEVELMRTVCNLVATALERAGLVSSLKNSRAELEERVEKRTVELREKQEKLEARAGELRANNEALKTHIRERKQAEEALRESKARLGAVFQSMSDAVFVSDVEGNFIDFNDAFATFHRFGDREECYKALAEYPDYIDVYFADGTPAPLDMWAVPRALRGETVSSAEYILQKKDTGEKWWGSYSFGPIRDQDGRVVGSVVVGRDITEGKLAEEALRKSEERFRDLADNIPNLAWMARADGWIFWYNRQWYDYTGTDFEGMQGWGWQKVHHPDYIKTVTDEWSARISEGKPYDNIFPLRGKDGNYRWFLTRIIPIKDERGVIQRWFGTNTDITERKRAEEALEEARMRAELYLDLVGHDISNMHQIMESQLELAREIMAEEGKLEGDDIELIDTPLRTLLRSNKLIDNVRKLQKMETGEYRSELVDIGGMLAGVVVAYSQIPGKGMSIDYAPVHGYRVEANPLLKDVFANLVDNALKHSNGPAHVGIRVGRVSEGGMAYYRVAIEDDGSGIPDAKKGEIFHRLKREQPMARGTGLGLFMAKSIVESFHGRIRVEDRVPGDHTKGSRFLVYLPVAEDKKC